MHRPGRVASAALALGLLLTQAAHAATGELTVSAPWIRFLTPGVPAAGYFTLHNAGDTPIQLVGARSPACGALMLHESSVDNGTARMQMVHSVTVPAHGKVQFRPGGYHLMCMHPAAGMSPGQHVMVSLQLQDGGSIQAQFPVYGATGKP